MLKILSPGVIHWENSRCNRETRLEDRFPREAINPAAKSHFYTGDAYSESNISNRVQTWTTFTGFIQTYTCTHVCTFMHTYIYIYIYYTIHIYTLYIYTLHIYTKHIHTLHIYAIHIHKFTYTYINMRARTRVLHWNRVSNKIQTAQKPEIARNTFHTDSQHSFIPPI